MSLHIYNSQSHKKEEFKPLEAPQVKMYVCGPTVYDLLHVGNFRGPIFFNLVRNWLAHLGYQVKFVFNYTDVDDKIINRAQQEGVAAEEIAEKYIREFQADYQRLGLRTPDVIPRVTETMNEIKTMIGQLIENQKAYVSDHDVLYSIEKFTEYGKLSGRNTEDLLTGVRIDPTEKKRSPLDFALWKAAKEGEPFWESAWGKGRPGWHIECSAMIKKHLGDTIDIHGGGMDLLFPHHENEVAQSEGANQKPFVRYWMHNNMINFGGAKMSKSLGNIRTARSFMDQYTPEVFKFMILSSHYRSVSDLSPESIEQAIAGLARIYSALALADEVEPTRIAEMVASKTPVEFYEKLPAEVKPAYTEAWKKIETALNDDFNTSEVMAVLFEQVRAFNTLNKRGQKPGAKAIAQAQLLKFVTSQVGRLMNLFLEPAADYLKNLDDLLLQKKEIKRTDVDRLVNSRTQARAEKNFAESDRLREELTKLGISVSDLPSGSYWEVSK